MEITGWLFRNLGQEHPRSSISIYDSMQNKPDESTIFLVTRFLHSTENHICIKVMHVEKQTNSHDCGVLPLHLQRHRCMDKILLNYHTMNYESTLQVVLMLRALHLFLLQWYTDNHRYSTKSMFLSIANADPQMMEN